MDDKIFILFVNDDWFVDDDSWWDDDIDFDDWDEEWDSGLVEKMWDEIEIIEIIYFVGDWVIGDFFLLFE